MERRIVRIWSAGDQLPKFLSALLNDRADLRRTLQYIQADAAELVDIWVVDFGQESDLGRCHGIVVW